MEPEAMTECLQKNCREEVIPEKKNHCTKRYRIPLILDKKNKTKMMKYNKTILDIYTYRGLL